MEKRRAVVSGNWKMNTDLASAVELADDVVAGCAGLVEDCDVVLYPPFPYLQAVGKTMGHHGLLLGAQDVYHEPNGPYTGEVSTDMLLDLNVQMVLVGHSERRHRIGEDDELINAKVRAALAAGLNAVVCVGETQEQRQAGQTNQVNVAQIMAALRGIGGELVRRVTIAYEPVWAIGTGKTATTDQADSAHAHLRNWLASRYNSDVGDRTRILYGGSVKPDNALSLLGQPNVDGALVGGASLKAELFLPIVQAAVEVAG